MEIETHIDIDDKGKLFERRGRKAIGTKLRKGNVSRAAVPSFGVCLFGVSGVIWKPGGTGAV